MARRAGGVPVALGHYLLSIGDDNLRLESLRWCPTTAAGGWPHLRGAKPGAERTRHDMNLSSLQALTWSTVAAAVASALALAAVEPPSGPASAVTIGSGGPVSLPTQPTAADPAASAVVSSGASPMPGTGGL